MKLFINGEEVQHSTENEKNLLDIMLALDETIARSGGVITSVLVNDKSISVDDGDALSRVALNDIQTLKLEASKQSTVPVEQLESVYEYIRTIERIVRGQDSSASLADNAEPHADEQSARGYNIHKDDIAAVVNALDILTARRNVSSTATDDDTADGAAYSPIKYLFLYACRMTGVLDDTALAPVTYSKQAAHMLHTAAACVRLRALQYAPSCENAARTNELMLEHIPEIKNISQLLVTGEEELALQYFIATLDFISGWLYMLPLLGKNSNTQTAEQPTKQTDDAYTLFKNTIEEFIKDLTDSLEAKDWITVSDLLEYEIVPELEKHAARMKQFYP